MKTYDNMSLNALAIELPSMCPSNAKKHGSQNISVNSVLIKKEKKAVGPCIYKHIFSFAAEMPLKEGSSLDSSNASIEIFLESQ